MSNIIIKIVNNDYINNDSIANAIHYIYRTPECKSKKTEWLPIYAYGIYTFPPTYESLITDFQAPYKITNIERSSQYQHLWHLIFCFDCSALTDKHYKWIDSIAGLLGLAFPLCYSYHYDTEYPHCHMLISTATFLPEEEYLTSKKLAEYLSFSTVTSSFRFQLNDEGGFFNV